MIELDYKLSLESYEDIESATEEDLHYGLFCGDIVFHVNGADFSADWGWVPVLDFAITLTRLVQDLPSKSCADFEYTESEYRLRLTLENEFVSIKSNYVSDTASVDYLELVDSCFAFLKRMLSELLIQYPSLKRNSVFMGYFKEFRLGNEG